MSIGEILLGLVLGVIACKLIDRAAEKLRDR